MFQGSSEVLKNYIELRGKRNGSSFFKSVYCLSDLGIVGKNRGLPKHVNSRKVAALIRTHCNGTQSCSFFTIL